MMSESKQQEDEQGPIGWMCRLSCFTADLFVGVAVLFIFRFLVLKHVLSIDAHQIYAFVKANPVVIKWIIWPMTGFGMLLLLRDVIMRILYQIPSFIFRSRYGSPVEHEPPKQKTAEKEDRACASQSASGAKSKPSTQLPAMTLADATRLTAIAIARIAKDFGLTSSGAARIRGTNYVFDDILQNGQDLYGVEVKCGYNRALMDRTLHELEMLRFSLPTDVRKRLTIILCVISQQTDYEWRDELMRRMKDAEMILRMYTKEELERD